MHGFMNVRFTVGNWWVWNNVTEQLFHLRHLCGFIACSTLQIQINFKSYRCRVTSQSVCNVRNNPLDLMQAVFVSYLI